MILQCRQNMFLTKKIENCNLLYNTLIFDLSHKMIAISKQNQSIRSIKLSPKTKQKDKTNKKSILQETVDVSLNSDYFDYSEYDYPVQNDNYFTEEISKKIYNEAIRENDRSKYILSMEILLVHSFSRVFQFTYELEYYIFGGFLREYITYLNDQNDFTEITQRKSEHELDIMVILEEHDKKATSKLITCIMNDVATFLYNNFGVKVNNSAYIGRCNVDNFEEIKLYYNFDTFKFEFAFSSNYFKDVNVVVDLTVCNKRKNLEKLPIDFYCNSLQWSLDRSVFVDKRVSGKYSVDDIIKQILAKQLINPCDIENCRLHKMLVYGYQTDDENVIIINKHSKIPTFWYKGKSSPKIKFCIRDNFSRKIKIASHCEIKTTSKIFDLSFSFK